MLFLPIHNKVAFGINILFHYLYPFISILMTRPLDWTLCTSCRYSSYHLKSQLCPQSLCTPKAASICHLIYIPKTTISPISDSLWGRSSNHSAGDASHGLLSQFCHWCAVTPGVLPGIDLSPLPGYFESDNMF